MLIVHKKPCDDIVANNGILPTKEAAAIVNDADSTEKQALDIVKQIDNYQIYETMRLATYWYYAQCTLIKKLTDDEKLELINLAKDAAQHDKTGTEEQRFFDSIVNLVNNGHSINELKKLERHELVSLMDEETNLYVY